MTDSLSLVTAQISFLEPQLSLIHIPIEVYTAFIQPIFQLLFGEDHDGDAAKIPWTNRHDFLNVTITPVECSVICEQRLAQVFFTPLLEQYKTAHGRFKSGSDGPEVGNEDYTVIQVDGQGLDAGQRVLELTSPLAMAGISIFFITTYFSDYILVPSQSRRTVTKALEQRGFVFSQSADAFVSQLSPSSPTLPQHRRTPSWPAGNGSMPSTPPAKDVPELQTRTFRKLERSNIKPLVNHDLRLVNCAGNRDHGAAADEQLKNDLLQVLLATTSATLTASATIKSGATTQPTGLGVLDVADTTASRPEFSTTFLSLTITSTEPISIFVEHRLLPRLGSSLLGAKEVEDTLIPITLDLRDLPMEATGIVCGVAGRLVQGATDYVGSSPLRGEKPSGATGNEEAIDITFLSTAKAGTVLVKAVELDRALEALEEGMREAARESP